MSFFPPSYFCPLNSTIDGKADAAFEVEYDCARLDSGDDEDCVEAEENDRQFTRWAQGDIFKILETLKKVKKVIHKVQYRHRH